MFGRPAPRFRGLACVPLPGLAGDRVGSSTAPDQRARRAAWWWSRCSWSRHQQDHI